MHVVSRPAEWQQVTVRQMKSRGVGSLMADKIIIYLGISPGLMAPLRHLMGWCGTYAGMELLGWRRDEMRAQRRNEMEHYLLCVSKKASPHTLLPQQQSKSLPRTDTI
jgi:hypothetical protein